jgi:hypothetical protein
MFEDLDQKKNNASPMPSAEDIFAGIKESAPAAMPGKASPLPIAAAPKKASGFVKVLIIILIVLILIVVGVFVAARYFGFTGLSQMKDKFFPSGATVIINEEPIDSSFNVGEEPAAKEPAVVEPVAKEPVSENVSATSSAPLDTDNDGLSDVDEGLAGTDPAKTDTDGDGLSDGEEYNIFKTSPLKADTDNDGLSDYDEVKTYLTDPNNPDTDADTYLDGAEVEAGYNPKGPGKLVE